MAIRFLLLSENFQNNFIHRFCHSSVIRFMSPRSERQIKSVRFTLNTAKFYYGGIFNIIFFVFHVILIISIRQHPAFGYSNNCHCHYQRKSDYPPNYQRPGIVTQRQNHGKSQHTAQNKRNVNYALYFFHERGSSVCSHHVDKNSTPIAFEFFQPLVELMSSFRSSSKDSLPFSSCSE